MKIEKYGCDSCGGEIAHYKWVENHFAFNDIAFFGDSNTEGRNKDLCNTCMNKFKKLLNIK